MSEGDDSGDAVCWLGMLCPECGAMPSDGDERCWRCGAPPERSGGASIPRRRAEEREAT
ncbi:hypothetical protein K1T35_14280 [Pseudonocardia sp. DSM 110487]|uniref:hypothetical protein n=1 Tax=Pseudonocardia sp. DSM 110487 TaxID=2865833 RepID=UPI001C6946F0|nr:hypothetical protein [Pseudonocardia sp. DSM 110487]QYN38287.1 hypothetical protein K1T35_14280 [Pseudonocardia sp. DSM 110487]